MARQSAGRKRSAKARASKPSPQREPRRATTAPQPSPPRVVIEAVTPEIDAGRFAAKRCVGEAVVVLADIFADGHETLAAVVRYREEGSEHWEESPLGLLANDRWSGRFVPSTQGWWEYTIDAWIDRFASWLNDLTKKHAAGQDVRLELLGGSQLVRGASERARKAKPADADWLAQRASALADTGHQAELVGLARDAELAKRVTRYADRSNACSYERTLKLQVECALAQRGAWYEMFPRSASDTAGKHGTFRDVEARLDYVASMGFDVLYLPPVHPIGTTHRKGPNNALECGPDDPGSPWAIGSAEGGHSALHPALGTFDDFDRLVSSAARRGIRIALDVAFQCSPDHPWVTEHPEWFQHRADGSIKYAENPPKKYQDIYPLNFESEDCHGLWQALRDVFLFWISHGVSIFRVDNPHTKAFPFWEWCLREVWDKHRDTIFLSEAFTRPKVMKYLAKIGFTQSYTYFTWRNDKQGLTDYFTELAQSECAEYLRPNLFVNTPDILHEYLQTGGMPSFMARLILAATLGASYGIYGPPFELCEGTPVRHGSEEYLDSEKYQLRNWDIGSPASLSGLIARVNEIRRQNPALHFNRNLRFFSVDNPQLLCYGKATDDLSNVIVVVVNLDPHHTQSGWVTLPTDAPGLGGHQGEYAVRDLIDGSAYTWRGTTNFVVLDPYKCPAHILRIGH